jgi:hypothetical protein
MMNVLTAVPDFLFNSPNDNTDLWKHTPDQEFPADPASTEIRPADPAPVQEFSRLVFKDFRIRHVVPADCPVLNRDPPDSQGESRPGFDREPHGVPASAGGALLVVASSLWLEGAIADRLSGPDLAGAFKV